MNWSIDKQRQDRARGRRRRAFTFVEVLVVVIIIGVLAALILPSFLGRTGQARQATAKSNMRQIETAIQMFSQDYNRYPRDLDELVNRPSDISQDQWNTPTIKPSALTDPWGNEYNYRHPGENYVYDLYSYGADNQPGGEDENADITNWDDGSSASASSS